MRCGHNYQQCACTASNAQLRLQAIEYLNISGLVIDFATGLVIAILGLWTVTERQCLQ